MLGLILPFYVRRCRADSVEAGRPTVRRIMSLTVESVAANGVAVIDKGRLSELGTTLRHLVIAYVVILLLHNGSYKCGVFRSVVHSQSA